MTFPLLKRTTRVHSLALTAMLGLTIGAQAQQTNPQVESRVNGILSQMTLDEKIAYISGENFGTPFGVFNIKPITRLGVPEILVTDGSIGVVGDGFAPGVRFPSGPLLAATWNPARATEEGVAQGREGRARGIFQILGPGVDFYRTPFGGRNAEYMTGEDPFLGAVMVSAEINGMQSQGVMSTTKHYVTNDQEINRFGLNVVVDERTLREIYLPPFEGAVKLGHSAAFLSGENLVNGQYNSANYFLETTVLKQDWGFPGFIETDTAGDHNGVQAALAGNDLDQPGNYAQFIPSILLPAIQSGQIPISNIDDKVRRILRKIYTFGFADRPQQITSIPINDPQSKTAALNVAREGIVLLKNDSKLLPLSKTSTLKIAVVGPNAQGEPSTVGASAKVPDSSDFTSEVDGIKAQVPTATVDYLTVLLPDPATAPWQTGDGRVGLIGQYYNSSDLSGSPVATRVDTELNFTSFNTSNVPVSNPNNFSAVWTGQMQPTITGYQIFKVSSLAPAGAGFAGANVRLFVNNQLIADDSSPAVTANTPITAAAPIVPISGKIYLQAGATYSVRLEAKKLGTGGLGGPGSGLQASWASLQPPANLANYDAVIVAVGGNEQYEAEGHDRSFTLPEEQDTLIQNLVQANPRTVVVLHGSGGFDVQAWINQVPAVLHAWFPGQYGGQALAEILFGVVNPSGKLPITMEKRVQDNPASANFPTASNATTLNYSEGLFIGYRGYEKNGVLPQYPFGHGLSYTTFTYTNLSVSPSSTSTNSQVRATFQVSNVGSVAGSETAQLYVAPVNAPVSRPIKELKGFAKVSLAPGESRKVTITLDRRALAYYNVDAHAWTVAPGTYGILVGASSQDIRLSGSLLNLLPSSLSVLDSTPAPNTAGPFSATGVAPAASAQLKE